MVYQTVVYQTLRSVIPTGLLPLLRSGSPLRRPTFRLRARWTPPDERPPNEENYGGHVETRFPKEWTPRKICKRVGSG